MQSCVLPPEPLRAVVIGSTRLCRLVLLLNSSYLEIDAPVMARLGMRVRLGAGLTVWETQVGQCVQLCLFVPCSCPVYYDSFPKMALCPES